MGWREKRNSRVEEGKMVRGIGGREVGEKKERG